MMYSKLLKGSMRRMMCVFWELCPHPEVGDPALSLTDRGHWQGPKAPKIFVCIAVLQYPGPQQVWQTFPRGSAGLTPSNTAL